MKRDPWTWWKPKALNRDVTNLEIWFLIIGGIVVGRLWNSQWLGFVLLAGCVGGLIGIPWWRGYCGLDQWPDPYGRYYKRWLRLPQGHGDYYDWLAREMGNREPWTDWAQRDREIV